jgi:hypothetical protein
LPTDVAVGNSAQSPNCVSGPTVLHCLCITLTFPLVARGSMNPVCVGVDSQTCQSPVQETHPLQMLYARTYSYYVEQEPKASKLYNTQHVNGLARTPACGMDIYQRLLGTKPRAVPTRGGRQHCNTAWCYKGRLMAFSRDMGILATCRRSPGVAGRCTYFHGAVLAHT